VGQHKTGGGKLSGLKEKLILGVLKTSLEKSPRSVSFKKTVQRFLDAHNDF
jgi:hypothetical protein